MRAQQEDPFQMVKDAPIVIAFTTSLVSYFSFIFEDGILTLKSEEKEKDEGEEVEKKMVKAEKGKSASANAVSTPARDLYFESSLLFFGSDFPFHRSYLALLCILADVMSMLSLLSFRLASLSLARSDVLHGVMSSIGKYKANEEIRGILRKLTEEAGKKGRKERRRKEGEEGEGEEEGTEGERNISFSKDEKEKEGGDQKSKSGKLSRRSSKVESKNPSPKTHSRKGSEVITTRVSSSKSEIKRSHDGGEKLNRDNVKEREKERERNKSEPRGEMKRCESELRSREMEVKRGEEMNEKEMKRSESERRGEIKSVRESSEDLRRVEGEGEFA